MSQLAAAPPIERVAPPGSERLLPYIPRLAIEWLRDHPERRHTQVEGSLAFVDISGFTNLTERLSRKGKVGAEEMNQILNECFTEFLSTAYDFGAGVLKWGGDAVLLLFQGDEHERRACRAAFEMQRVMRRVGRIKTGSGGVTLRMSIGISSGVYDFFLVGELHRELVITGPGASETVAMESVAEAGEIALSPSTAAAIAPADLGEQKGLAVLLRRGPKVVSERSAPIENLADVDVGQCVPVEVREHLLGGGGEPEHRPMTAAFIHFMGADDLLAGAGPEALADALEVTLAAVERIAHQHRIAFFDTDIYSSGGKIMLMAGAPRSAGSDEERMLRAMRAIMDAGLPLPLRIGVNWGRIFVGDFGPPYRRTYTVTGDAVNLAARLMAKAEPGQILATEEVLARSRTAFGTEALEPFQAKGKSEPVHAFVVGSTGARAERSSSVPLVGRDSELAVLLEAAESAQRYEGRLAEIVAEPGMGKSRLVEELRVRSPGMRALTVQCEEYEASTPYFAFKGILRGLLGIGDVEDEAQALRAEVATRAPQLLPWLPLIGVPAGIHVPETPETEPLEERFRKERLEATVGELLGMLLLEPTLLVFEDVHWLDDASADLLRHLATIVENHPWLILVARRDEDTGFTVPEGMMAIVVRLEPLPADQALALVETATDESPLPPHQMRALAERAGGNPLFLTELLAAAHAAGSLEELPDSVEGLMMAEIDRLSPRDRAVLRSAAVIGAAFTRDLLDEALGADAPDESGWQRLSEFLLDEGHGNFRFRHALVRDAAYEGLPYRRRRDLHERVAEAIEERAPQPDEEAELLSLHYFHAHDFELAWRFSRVAGERARALYANHEAATFLERALASGRRLAPVSRAELSGVAEALGDVRDRAGDFKEAEAAYREARRLHPGHPVDEARLMLKHAWIPERLGRYSQALRWIRRGQRLLDTVEGQDAARQRAQLHAWHGAIRNHQGRFAEAIVWCQRAIEEAEPSGERRALAHAYCLLDWAYVALGLPHLATYSPRALVIYEELGDLPRQAAIYNDLGARAYFQGDWQEALELYATAQRMREQVGDPVYAAMAACNMAEILTDQGALEEAEVILKSALRVWRAAGWRAQIATASKLLGKVEARSGRPDEALGLLAQAHSVFREVGAQSELNETEGWMAECHLLQGNGREALQFAGTALARARKAGGFEVAMLKRVRAYALMQVGLLDEARAALDEAVDTARRRQMDYELALGLEGLLRLTRLEDGIWTEELELERDSIFERLGVVSVVSVPLPAPALAQ